MSRDGARARAPARQPWCARAWLLALLLVSLGVGCTNPNVRAQGRVLSVVSIGDSFASGEGAPNPSLSAARWRGVGFGAEHASPCQRSLVNGRRLAVEALDVLLLSVGGNDAGFANVVMNCLGPGALYRHGRCADDPQLQNLVRTGDYGAVPFAIDPCRALGAYLAAEIETRPELTAALAGESGRSVTGLIDWILALTTAQLSRAGEAALPYPRLLADDRNVLGLNRLPAAYARLAQSIASLEPPPTAVIVTTYPEPLQDETGAFCHRVDDGMVISLLQQPAVTGIGASLENVTRDDDRWMLEALIRPLNTIIRDTAKHGWYVADGVAQAMRAHGYCAQDPWFNTPRASWELQDDFLGTAHPNAAGHQAYGDVLLAALRDVLKLPPQ